MINIIVAAASNTFYLVSLINHFCTTSTFKLITDIEIGRERENERRKKGWIVWDEGIVDGWMIG